MIVSTDMIEKYDCAGDEEGGVTWHEARRQKKNQNKEFHQVFSLYIFISSDRSSYSNSVLLYIQQQQRPLFEILRISANMYLIIDSVYETLSAL